MPMYSRVSSQLQVMLEGALSGRNDAAAAVEHTAELIAAITGLPMLERADAGVR